MKSKPRLNDEIRAAILADYAREKNYTRVAKHYGVADNTVKRIVQAHDAELNDLNSYITQKQLERANDFTEREAGKAYEIIDKIMDRLNNPELLNKCTGVQLATITGILMDKWGTSSRRSNIGVTICDDIPAEDVNKAQKNENA